MKATNSPRGIPFIIVNEAAERFSYYGMKAILVVFMVRYLQDSSGQLAPMSEPDAKAWYHLFSATNYFFPVVGALLADIFLGKYRTIILLSLLYCLGHGVLTGWDTRFGLAAGLFLIALGAGGIKPCVSAHVGDQFTEANSHLLARSFGWFYLAINGGAFVSTLVTPWLLEKHGPSIAFGTPAVLMLLATWVFWLGHTRYVTLPPVGWRKFSSALRLPDTRRSLRKLIPLYLFIAVFWSLYDQTGSTWVLQAEHLNRVVELPFIGLKFEVLSAQLQALNCFFVFVYVPLFSLWLYPLLGTRFNLTVKRKMAVGFALCALAFLVLGLVELSRADFSAAPTILWQVLAYAILTAAEVLVYWTGLEFSYTAAPRELKSFIMGLYLLSISLGNAFTALVNYLLSNYSKIGTLSDAAYLFLFAGIMAATTISFALFYERTAKVGKPA